jgi:hypothetical protein
MSTFHRSVCASILVGLPSMAMAQTPTTAGAQEAVAVSVAQPAPVRSKQLLLERDTLVRLMVTKEVNSRTARRGDRFVLRVDEDVQVNGRTVIPTGAKAFGEVVSAEENGAVGKAGTMSARLLHIELGEGRIPISGEEKTKGAKGADRVLMSIVGFGVFGLLARGNNAKLKAGDIFNGYIAEDILIHQETGVIAKAAPAQP